MIKVAALTISVLVGGAAELQPKEASTVHVLYSPFRLSCWSRLDSFPQNAWCNFDRDVNDPAMRRVLEIVSKAPEISDRSITFSDQWVRLSIQDPKLNQSYHVDKFGRVQIAPNKAARQIAKGDLAELENALDDMCPRLKRVKDARLAKSRAGKAKK